MRGRSFLVIIITLITSWSSYANDINEQNTETASSSEIEYDVYYDFTPKKDLLIELFAPNKPIQVSLRTNLPQTIPHRQEILEIKFDPEPARMFDQNGNSYAEFNVSIDKKVVRIHIHVNAKVFNYDLATAMEKTQRTAIEEPNLAEFLKPERMIECDDFLIQQLAKDINGADEIEVLHNIYNFVISYLDTDLSKLKGVGAAKTARDKKGMCIDCCDLFTAICRAKGIPARVVAGYQPHFYVSPKHSWVEVYFKEYGWVPFDPSQSKETDKAILDILFYHSGKRCLLFTRIRNDTVLGYNYFYGCPNWNKDAQNRIRVVETIEFIKPMRKKHDSREDIERDKARKQS